MRRKKRKALEKRLRRKKGIVSSDSSSDSDSDSPEQSRTSQAVQRSRLSTPRPANPALTKTSTITQQHTVLAQTHNNKPSPILQAETKHHYITIHCPCTITPRNKPSQPFQLKSRVALYSSCTNTPRNKPYQTSRVKSRFCNSNSTVLNCSHENETIRTQFKCS